MLRTMAVLSFSCWLRRPPRPSHQEKWRPARSRKASNVDAAKRSAFIKKCMAKGNYEPAARKNAKTAPKPQ